MSVVNTGGVESEGATCAICDQALRGFPISGGGRAWGHVVAPATEHIAIPASVAVLIPEPEEPEEPWHYQDRWCSPVRVILLFALLAAVVLIGGFFTLDAMNMITP